MGAALAAGAVPAPWTPVTAKDGVVSVWGREYAFASNALPVGVKTAGRETLAGPMRIVCADEKGNEIIEEDSIADQDYSLNAGRYVGVVIEDDGMTAEEFKQTMLDLHGEFEALNAEARKLEEQIALNLKGLLTNG